ncbi:MAG: hypothetical protein AB8B55_21255 [Mariniblastus sp.]
MAETFNPFHKWLGFKPNVKNPHHFQLLGVSTKLTDPAEIHKAVDAGVKRHLAVLAKVPPGKADVLVAKIKKRIAKARATLLDDSARVAYLEKLKSQIRVQQSGVSSSKIQRTVPGQLPASSPELRPPTSAAQVPPPTQMPSAPQASSSPIRPATPRVPDAPIVNIPTPDVPSFEPPPATPNIPSAIPMAVPLSQAPQGIAQPVAVPQPEQAFDEDGMPTKVKINKNAVRRRPRFKYAAPLAAGFLFLTTGIGGYLIYSNLDKILAMAGIDPDVPPAPGIVDTKKRDKPDDDSENDIPGINNSGNDSDDEVKPLPKIDLAGIPEIKVDEVMNHEATLAATGRKPRSKPPTNGDNMANVPPMRNKPATKVPIDPKPVPKQPSKNLKLDEGSMAKFRRHIHRARRSLFRRDKGVTLEELDESQAILNEAGSNLAYDFDPTQRPIAKLVAATEEVTNMIEGFWLQVISSCQTIPQGQEITIGNQRIAFIAATKEDFTIRKSGSNVTFKYHFCPPGLAVALASQGAIEDVPTWEKQLAAFYAVNQVLNVDYQTQVDKHMAIAEEAGHDGELIRHYADFDFDNFGKPESKIEMPSQKKVDEIAEVFRSESNYEKVRDLSPARAGELANLLFKIDSPNFEQHLVLLDEARRLSIRAGDAFMVEDAVIEMGIYADIDQPNLTCESFLELAKSKNLSRVQVRALLETSIPFLRSKESEMAKPKSIKSLFSRLVQVADKNDMSDSASRLAQLAREKMWD